MKKRYYVAYGSNLNIGQMRRRCPLARIVGTSEIRDYQLVFKGSGSGAYLTIEPKAGSIVPVAVWAVTAGDERALDRYEGFPTFYYKKGLTLPVRGVNGGETRILDTFVYIMHEDRELGMPTQYYVQICREGYEAFGFDEAALLDALDYTAKEMGL